MRNFAAQLFKFNDYINFQFSGMKKSLLFLMMFLSTVCVVNATTYYWVGGAAPAVELTDRSNWSTIGVGGAAVGTSGTLITMTSADILIIDGSDISSAGGLQTGAITVTFTTTPVTIGQLKLQTGASFTTTAGGGRVLNIAGGSGADLDLPTGCTFGTSGSGTSVVVQTGATASITGTYNCGAGSNAHTIVATDAGSVVFGSGATFNARHASGGPFGTAGTNGGVIFQSGALYVQNTTSGNPFQLTAPNALVTFQSGSTFRQDQSAAPSMAGRTYGNFIWNNTGSQSPTGGTAVTFLNSITIAAAGTLNLNLTGGVNIGGNIAVNAGTLTFNAASGTVNFNGTTAQTISKTGTLTFGAGPSVVISNTTSTVSVNSAQTFSGSMTVNAGATLVAGGVTVTLAGTPAINGSFRINQGGWATGGTWAYGSGGTLIFNNSSGSYNVNADVWWPTTSGPVNVTVAGAGGITMNVARTVSGTFQTAAGVAGTALTLNGIAQINAGGFFSTTPVYGVSSTLVYNSGSTYGRGAELTTGTGIPANITINAGSSLDYGNGATGTARTITGNLTANGGFFMDFSTNDMTQALTVNGNVVIGTSGTVSLSDAAGGDIRVGGSWTITGSGAFNPKARAVFFVNTGTSTITTAATANFDFLIVDKTGGGSVVLANNATVNNTLTLTTGNLSIGANTLTLNAAVSRTAGFLAGGNTSSLVIGGTAGSLHFDNTGTNNYLKGFTINTGASATLANDLNITAYDGVGAEGVLTVAGTGVLTTGGFLSIKSSANGTGRIAANTTSTTYISGNVSVERFIPQNSSKGWRLLASNTTGQTINAAWQEGQANSASNTNPGFGTQISAGNALGLNLAAAQAAGFDALSTGVSLFKYNPATDGLESVSNTASTGLASEPGYFIFIRGDRSGGGSYGGGAPTTSTVLRSKGSVFMGNFSTATGAQNYGLVRNPYASRIDMRGFDRSSGSNLNDAYQVWDAKLGGAFGVGGYQTFFKSGADYLVTPGGGSYGANGSVQNFIESGTAFFIQSVSNTNNSLTIPESSKAAASSTGSFRPATPLAGESRIAFNLYANNNGGSVDLVDGGLAYFANEYSNAVDVQDIKKSLNFNENFGMKRANTDVVIERKQPIDQNDTIFFHMTSLRSISYRLDVEATNMDPLITTAVLKDKYTNTNTTLDLATVNAYTFTVDANAASRAADRFSIVFRQSGVVPVSFVSVKAAQAGNNIAVEWKVANEVNTVRYEVEKSTDGRNFSKKGTVLATGANTYNWLDENAVNGFNYYRVRSVDNNGQVKYTQVVKIQLGGKAGISISPNPVQGGFVNILINQPLTGKYGIRLTNIAGQAVYNREVTHNGGSSSQSFVLPSALSNGVYQLEVIAPDNTRQVEKLIIQGN